MKIDLEAHDPALYSEFVWFASVTGIPIETLVMRAITEGLPIARARYDWDRWGDDVNGRLKRLNEERRALKAVIRWQKSREG